MGGIVDLPPTARPFAAEVRRESFYLGIGGGDRDGWELRGAATDEVGPREIHREGVLVVPAARVPAMRAALDEVDRWMVRAVARQARCRHATVLRAVENLPAAEFGRRDLARALPARVETASALLDALTETGLLEHVTAATALVVSRGGGDGGILESTRHRWRRATSPGWQVAARDEVVTLAGPVVTFGLGRELAPTQAVELLYRDLPALRDALAAATVPA